MTSVRHAVRNSQLYIYADDCSLFLLVRYDENVLNSSILLQEDLDRLSSWSTLCKLDFKAEKCMEVIFHSVHRKVRDFQQLHLQNANIPRGQSHRHLGMTLDARLTFEEHLIQLVTKCNTLNPLISLKGTCSQNTLKYIYHLFCLTLNMGSASARHI
jgi:hypothetical protein